MATSTKVPTPTELEQRIKSHRQAKEEKINAEANELCELVFNDIAIRDQKELSKYKASILIQTNDFQKSEQLLRALKKFLQPTWNLNWIRLEYNELGDEIDYKLDDDLHFDDDTSSIYKLDAKATTYQLYELKIQPFKLKYFIADECVICYEPMTKISNMPYFKACGHACICDRPKCREDCQKLTTCPMCRKESEIALTKKIKIKKRLIKFNYIDV